VTRAEVGGDVENVNGDIAIKGATVGGSVETVNGDILIGRDSVVRGDIVVHRPKGFSFGKSTPPKVTIEAGATVEGRFVFKREVTLSVDPAAKVANSEPVER
jgi:cytoskeletal protein CcmA (bactofilin family)